MSNWVPHYKLIERGWTLFQIMECLQKGLFLPFDSMTGIVVVPPDIQPRYEALQRNLDRRLKLRLDLKRLKYVTPGIHMSEAEIIDRKWQLIREIQEQKRWISVLTKNLSGNPWKSFSLRKPAGGMQAIKDLLENAVYWMPHIEMAEGVNRKDYPPCPVYQDGAYWRVASDLEEYTNNASTQTENVATTPNISNPITRESTKDKKSFQTWAKGKYGSGPWPGETEIALKARDDPQWSMYEVRTIVKWLRPIHPDYTPGKPGRKKKSADKDTKTE